MVPQFFLGFFFSLTQIDKNAYERTARAIAYSIITSLVLSFFEKRIRTAVVLSFSQDATDRPTERPPR